MSSGRHTSALAILHSISPCVPCSTGSTRPPIGWGSNTLISFIWSALPRDTHLSQLDVTH